MWFWTGWFSELLEELYNAILTYYKSFLVDKRERTLKGDDPVFAQKPFICIFQFNFLSITTPIQKFKEMRTICYQVSSLNHHYFLTISVILSQRNWKKGCMILKVCSFISIRKWNKLPRNEHKLHQASLLNHWGA